MGRYKYFIALVLSLIAVIGGVFYITNLPKASKEGNTTTASQSDRSAAAYGLLGSELPIFTITDAEGKQISSSDFKGKPTVIMEWASWCPHCQKTIPVMDKLYRKYKDEVEFVFINATGSADGKETKEAASSYIKKNNFEISYYYDEGLKAATVLQVESVPTFFFVDRSGIIREVANSDLNEEEAENMIKNIVV